jgi:uncharacterized membrane protein YeaQ/YmgE (transglycosylase-associated protein family)
MPERLSFSTSIRQAPKQLTHRKGRKMGLEGLIIALVIGAIAGWLAGLIVKGGGFGLLGDIVVGIIGSLVAGWLFPRLGVSLGGGWIGAILSSTLGAIIVLLVLRIIRRAG